MEIKDKISLTQEETVQWLNSLAKGLDDSGHFQFEIADEKVTLNVGKSILADINISDGRVTIELSWKKGKSTKTEKKEEEKDDWRSEFDEEMSKEGLTISKDKPTLEEIVDDPILTEPSMVKEVKLPEELDEEEEVLQEEEAIEEDIVMVELTTRKLPTRLQINSTTLPYDGGYWTPSFTPSGDTQWVELQMNEELENAKWATLEEITSLSDLTPVSSRRESSSVKNSEDDDLFSDLESLVKPKIKTANRRGVQRISTPSKAPIKNRTSAIPPAKITHSMSEDDDLEEEATKWKEPTLEDDESEDAWVKPSEVLKAKRVVKTRSVPTPKTQVKTEFDKKSIAKRISGTETTLSSALSKIEDDRINKSNLESLKEEESKSESSISDTKKEKKKSSIPSPKKKNKVKADRPPPDAPDNKNDKKGWADW